jgi:hypothetical protein
VAGAKPVKLFDVRDVTDGREGGAFRYLGDGRAMLSVLHPEHADDSDVEGVTYGANWRFWTYDFASDTASPIDAIDWNAGAAYPASGYDRQFTLVPSGDYTATTVYELGADRSTRAVLETNGWALRMFPLK